MDNLWPEISRHLIEAGINMEEVAAAIAPAFNLHILRCSPKNNTIKRLSHSLWKESLRAKAVERL